jgi:lipoyl(octanoyl) transferase
LFSLGPFAVEVNPYNEFTVISVLNLGRCDYGTALHLQETLVELRKHGRVGNTLLFVEHPAVITLGRNADDSNIVAPRSVLEEKGVELFEINRGGDVTFHGPGQLVAYPIFDLRSFSPKIGVVEFVRRLEDVLMRICASYRIETQRIAGMTGVWTMEHEPLRVARERRGGVERDYARDAELEAPRPESARKIAAIGVHISRGVTSHGFALNVTTDLDYFKLIVPCGLTKPVTSIEFETGERPSLEDVANLASRSFGEVFQSQILWLDSIHDLIPEEGDPANPQDTPAQEPAELRAIRGDTDRLV